MKNTITACIVVYNEEKHIEACLKSIARCVDEIIVIHDGPCTDATLRIAKKYTKHVSATKQRKGSAEFLRNQITKKATSQWILNIDADERLSKNAQKQIGSLVTTKEIDAYTFVWPFFSTKGILLEPHTRRRKKALFRKSKLFQISLPHMVGETKGKTAHTSLVLEHHFKTKKQQQSNLIQDLKKNVHRAKQAARLLRDLSTLDTYNCTLTDTTLSYVRKIRLIHNHPFIAMGVLTAYSFAYSYFKRKYFLDGVRGLHNALNVASYHFLLGYFRFTDKLGLNTID